MARGIDGELVGDVFHLFQEQPEAARSSSPPPTSTAPEDSVDKRPTSFEDLPAELRNRIYDLSGCLRYYQQPRCLEYSYAPRHTVAGDYLPQDHSVVHGCINGATCERSDWDDFTTWPAAYLHIPGQTPKPNNFNILGSCHDFNWSFHRHGKLGAFCDQATLAQPALTKVSKQVRADTLPIFYGNHPIVCQITGSEFASKAQKILDFLDMIGPKNASLLREIHVVYTKKRVVQYSEKELLPAMERRGVKTNEAVRFLKLGSTDQNDEESVLRLLDAKLGRK